jgi:signal transduction histidine kinase
MLASHPRRDLYLKLGTVLVLVLAVSMLHYGTQTTRPLLHDVYRRLYYIPVGLAAVWFGIRGGMLISAAVALIYVPHIVLHWNDMGRELMNRVMEVGLFFVFAGITGYFADRERRYRRRWQESAEKLEHSFGELKKQADIMLEIEEQLRRADRLSAIGELAAEMTHELRNPLGSIKGTAEILRDDFPAGHPKSEFLDILVNETDRLNQVVESFLGYARHKNVHDGVEEVALGGLVRDTLALVDTQARQAGITVTARIDNGLVVTGSRDQLKQVVLNLLLNALQATPQGKEVVVSAKAKPGKIQGLEYREVDGRIAVVAVEDRGPGLAHEVLPKVFDPFFTTRPEGTGLGLAISRRIAEAHGGGLVVENREDGGARFILSVPLSQRGGAAEVPDV